MRHGGGGGHRRARAVPAPAPARRRARGDDAAELGAYLSAMSAEGAADVLRELSLVWSNAGVEHMVSRRAAAALAQLPEDRLLEALVGVRCQRAAPILEALCEEGGVQDGACARRARRTALCKRSPDKCAAHVAAMVDVAMRGSETGLASPARGAPSRRLFARLPRHGQGAILSGRLSAKTSRRTGLLAWAQARRRGVAAAVAEPAAPPAAPSRRRPWLRSRTSGSRATATVTAPAPRRRSWRRCTPRTRVGFRRARRAGSRARRRRRRRPPRRRGGLFGGVKDPPSVAAMPRRCPRSARRCSSRWTPRLRRRRSSAMAPGLPARRWRRRSAPRSSARRRRRVRRRLG